MATGGGDSMTVNSATKDLISDLPRNIIESILERMPIQDAVKTSLLSRKWINNWRMLSQLVFDPHFFNYLKRKQITLTLDHARIIYRILLLHDGPILKFVLIIPHKGLAQRDLIEDVNNWILFLSTKGVKEFTFKNLYSQGPNLPTHLFSCLHLTHLNLYRCRFKPPTAFGGFPNLISLHFLYVTLETDSFESFVSSCPILKTLALEIMDASCDLKIHSSSLKHLLVSGRIRSLGMGDVQNLKMLSVSSLIIVDLPVTRSYNTNCVLSCFPEVKKLFLGSSFIKCLATGDFPRRLPAALNSLKMLKLSDLYFSDTCDEVFYALSLIRSSPNLQELEISIFAFSREMNVEEPGSFFWEEDCELSQLRTVRFSSAHGLSAELKCIKFLLACSPFLELMSIQMEEVADAKAGLMAGFKMLKRLTMFGRASTKAKILFSDPSEAKFVGY